MARGGHPLEGCVLGAALPERGCQVQDTSGLPSGAQLRCGAGEGRGGVELEGGPGLGLRVM